MEHLLFECKQFCVQAVRLFFSFISGGKECVVCGKKSFRTLLLCEECAKRYFSVNDVFEVERCAVCGRELISTKGTCMNCRDEPVLKHADKVVPLFSYRLWNKELLYRWKLNGERCMSSFFARLVSDVLKVMEIDAVVPVPPRKGKIKKNGWDQVDDLCEFLRLRYGFNVYELLERNSVVQQKQLNRVERLETIKSAYSLKPFFGKVPEKVCLIDDVCTTGSTIECCAAILKSAGVRIVNVVTLFVVD